MLRHFTPPPPPPTPPPPPPTPTPTPPPTPPPPPPHEASMATKPDQSVSVTTQWLALRVIDDVTITPLRILINIWKRLDLNGRVFAHFRPLVGSHYHQTVLFLRWEYHSRLKSMRNDLLDARISYFTECNQVYSVGKIYCQIRYIVKAEISVSEKQQATTSTHIWFWET